jgi:CpeT protein
MVTNQDMAKSLNQNDLFRLARWMAGDFSNDLQSSEQPTLYAHIHVFFRPLPFSFFKGIGFYSEQVYDYDLWSPYRQGVHRFINRGNDIYIENYGLDDAIRFAGAARESSILKTISPEDLRPRCNCGMVFEYREDCFIGRVEGNQCFISKNGAQTYLVSEVEVTNSTWSSLDRGFDINTHQQVWGSEHGALRFTKSQDFSHELSEA